VIKISHRGNLNGPNPKLENNPSYIEKVLSNSYSCEVDLWKINGNLFFGHDEPTYKISKEFLKEYSDNLWLHCKNLSAFLFVLDRKAELNGFWHQTDDFTSTTMGYIWTFPGKELSEKSICVSLGPPSLAKFPMSIAGVCSDFISQY
jgi:hypothetical protein